MQYRNILPKALLLAGAICLGAAAAKPAAAQYLCPDGYYYVEGYGCAPLSYYSSPFLVPGFGFGFGRGWGHGYYGHGWGHGGGFYHGGGGRHR